ncbi:MAG: hypothetical protein C5B54_07680 [Acidobacteria bacterium]|nr:MAG: hypothetical protein C5B54_07680 [Acidobacteriota bacterium]
MILDCEHCGKKGTLDEEPYSGKKVRLRCPYCSQNFIFAVPTNGNAVGAAIDETVMAPAAAIRIEQPVAVTPPPPKSVIAATPAPDVPDALVNEAKRIARLIISEIKLYNQDKLARMGSKKEVLALLKNDLVRGKQHYDSRIASRLPTGTDYFTETVKEILLAGKN